MDKTKVAAELLCIAKELVAREKRINILRRIVKDKQHEDIDGMMVDTLTANVLVKVYDALPSKAHSRFDRIPLKKLVDFAWSMVK